MKLIKTFEAACKAKGLSPENCIPDVSTYPAEHQKAVVAAAKLFIVVDVLNDGWKPNWNNDDEYKYYLWFDMEKSKSNPSGFRLDYVDFNYTDSHVGSRLCFKSREVAEHAAKHFISLFKDLMVL